MIHEKNEYSRLDCPFAEKKKDVNSGDIVQILSEAEVRPNKFDTKKMQTIIKIKTKNGPRYASLNQKSINALISELKSNDDEDWIGKNAKVLLNPTMIGDKRVIVLYLVGMNWELDDYGEPYDTTGGEPDGVPMPEEDSVNIEEVPF